MDSEMIYIILGSIATILLIFLNRKLLNKKHPCYHRINDGIVTVSIHKERRYNFFMCITNSKKMIPAITGDIKTKITATIL